MNCVNLEAAIAEVEYWKQEFSECDYVFPNIIDGIKRLKVYPVLYGHWKLDSDPGEPWRYVCSRCGEKTKDTCMGKPRWKYCPNCGAKME